MPKVPDIASDQEVSSFLKSSRSAAASPSATRPGTAEAAPAKEPGHVPEPSELDWQQRAGRGVAKTGASLGVNLARLGNEVLGYSSPTLARKLSDLAAQSPTAQKLERFADEPYQSVAEGAGGVGANIASFLFAPETGVGRGLFGAASKYGPPTMGFAKGAGIVPTTFGKIAGAGSTIAEGATKGAVGGTVSDPDDPRTGAISGAVGGAAIPVISGPAGRAVMSSIGARAPHAGLSALATFLNVPYHHLLNYAIGLRALTHEGSRVGRRAGEWVYDHLGRRIGYIDPVTGGIVGSQAQQYVMGPGGPRLPFPGSAAPTAPNYGFDEPEEDSGQGSQAPATQ